MEYLVLARKYRPQRFSDVVGQTSIVATLKNAIQMKRVAHAYLFSGLRGTGKTTLARLFAKALNCQNLSSEHEPCNDCPSCKEIASSHSMDVLEIDGASHRGIEDIRQINETVGFVPTTGRYKIYIIDEVHMLTKEAFNALLKTLEEPPSHVKFFFATTEAHRIPPTILSRCQRFNLGRVPSDLIQAKLASIAAELGLSVEPEALLSIASLAEGSLRDAESLFDQVIAFQTEAITLKTVLTVLGLPSRELFFSLDEAGAKGDFSYAFEMSEHLFASGKNVGYVLEELTSHFRTLFLLKQKVPYRGPHPEKYQHSSSLYKIEQLVQILEYLSEAPQNIKFAVSEKTALEMLLLRILRTHQRISIEALVQRLVELESKLSKSPQESLPPPSPPQKIQKKEELPKQTTFNSAISEDPIPKPHELPKQPVKPVNLTPQPAPIAKAPPVQKKSVTAPSEPKTEIPPSPPQTQAEKAKEQSRYDTVMRFAAKELNGFLKKD